jgi:hypothetical protein
MAISRIKTDVEYVKEAASKLGMALDEGEYNVACVDMADALLATRPHDWWQMIFQKLPASSKPPGQG